jgi:hypothetical protein
VRQPYRLFRSPNSSASNCVMYVKHRKWDGLVSIWSAAREKQIFRLLVISSSYGNNHTALIYTNERAKLQILCYFGFGNITVETSY